METLVPAEKPAPAIITAPKKNDKPPVKAKPAGDHGDEGEHDHGGGHGDDEDHEHGGGEGDD
jgi:hypothetical protein